MRSSQKKFDRLSPSTTSDEKNSATRNHASGITAPRLLFARVDRAVKDLQLSSRGDFMTAATTALLNMCSGDRIELRRLPSIVKRYDELRKRKRVGKIQIEDPNGAQRCGTHFSVETEERIAEVVKKIGWSRNQFIGEALKTIVDMCEDPETRNLPLVVILHDAAVNVVPYPLSS